MKPPLTFEWPDSSQMWKLSNKSFKLASRANGGAGTRDEPLRTSAWETIFKLHFAVLLLIKIPLYKFQNN